VTRADRLIVALVAALAIASWPVAMFASGGFGADRSATISGPGGTFTVPLGGDRMIAVQGRTGTVEVAVGSDGVAVVSSTCPDHVCIEQGTVDSGAIVCAPNGVSIRIGGGADALDAHVR